MSSGALKSIMNQPAPLNELEMTSRMPFYLKIK